MALLKVNPTRMVLMQCQQKLATASQGHRMLKEKQDSMIRQFMKHYDLALTLRRQIDDDIAHMHTNFSLASLEISEELLDREVALQSSSMNIKAKQMQVFGLAIPQFELTMSENEHEINESLIASHHRTDLIRGSFSDMQSKLIELTQQEAICSHLAHEIKATRRRVNSLEYKTIPDLKETIAYIKLRIDDQVRGQQARIMKVTK